MARTVIAVFDGQVLRPETPLDLETNARYHLTIAPAAAGGGERDAWDVLEALGGSVEAPLDWAAEHDHYLYGAPKRHGRGNE
jgi:hypothetical protein